MKLVYYIKVRRENLEEFLEKRRQPQQFETLRRECRDARQAPLAAAILSSRVETARKLEAISHPTAFIETTELHLTPARLEKGMLQKASVLSNLPWSCTGQVQLNRTVAVGLCKRPFCYD